MISTETADHLFEVEALDMRLFDTAMSEGGIDAGAATRLALAGAAPRSTHDLPPDAGYGNPPIGPIAAGFRSAPVTTGHGQPSTAKAQHVPRRPGGGDVVGIIFAQ